MRRFIAVLVLVAFATGTEPTLAGSEAIRTQIARLQPGDHISLKLAAGRRLEGTLVAASGDTVDVRVARGFFRYRTETCRYDEVVEVKKQIPRWVFPVVIFGALAGLLIGLGVCIQSGACLA